MATGQGAGLGGGKPTEVLSPHGGWTTGWETRQAAGTGQLRFLLPHQHYQYQTPLERVRTVDGGRGKEEVTLGGGELCLPHFQRRKPKFRNVK